MSSTLKETLTEFESQLRLEQENVAKQKEQEHHPSDAKSGPKTRVDDDGTVMEWDGKQRAWVPKLDEDFIAQYQMNFGIGQSQQQSYLVPDEHKSAHAAWMLYAGQIAQLKAERGENDPEVQAATTKLDEYYSSPAYRAWYTEFQRQSTLTGSESENRDEMIGADIQPGLQYQAQIPLSADEALEKAATEHKLGIPMASHGNAAADDDDDDAKLKDGESHIKQNARKRKNKGPPEWYEVDDEKNTHVYVCGLPPTITEEQFTELMSKCGIIMNDPISNKLRVKLYRNADGKPKGDGRCCYIKVESVNLAMQILDGMLYEPGYTLQVTRAKFEPKKDFDPAKHRRMTNKEKKLFKKSQEGLFKWKLDTSRLIREKKERVIILRNVFDEADLGLDVSLIPIVRERVRLQCAKVGVVKKIVVYDTHPEGIVSVTFSSPEEADVALQFLDKALFTYPAPDVQLKAEDEDNDEGSDTTGNLQRTRQLSATRWDGRERFIKQETLEEKEDRLNRWNNFLGESEEGVEFSDNENKELLENIEEREEDPPEAVDTDEELREKGGLDSGAETD